MPTFEISGPDGGHYQIDAPDEGSAVAAFSSFGGNQNQGTYRTQDGRLGIVVGGPQNKPVSTTEDVLKTIPSGVARGVSGMVGLPGTVEGWIGQGINALGEAAGFKPVQPVETPTMPSGKTVEGAVEKVTGPLYHPQTRAGRYANTVSEFAPAALAPGGVLSNLIKYAVIPGVSSEAAGELTHEVAPSLEPYVRGATAFATGAGAATLTRPSAARAVRGYADGVTRQQVQRAEQLFQEAQAAGIPITRAEALQHVTQNGTRMGDMQRVVEGQGELKDFFAQRPQQNERAFGRVVDDVQPLPTPQPSNIGPQAAETAGNVVTDVRKTINKASDPFYKNAENVLLGPSEMSRVRALPGYQEARDAVRGNPQLNRNVAHLPENSVGFLNEVKKQLDQMAENAAGPMNAQRNQQISAGHGQDATAVRQAAEAASPDYAVALGVQSQARQRYLDPLLRGPIGKLAKEDQATQAAISALFPANPIPNSAQEVGQAVSALAQRRPHVARDLVRAHLESVFNESTQNLIGGANQFGGAKFAANLRGNVQQAENLEAAIRALPGGDKIWPGVDRFLSILEAQGTRQRIGSQTAFNQEMLQDLRGGTIGGSIAKGGIVTQLPKKASDVWERWRLGRNVAELARLLTDPRAANEFARLATANGSQASALVARLTFLGLPKDQRN